MGWSLNIGSIAGTQVRIHLTFLLFLVWVFGASYASGGATAGWNSLIFIVLLFACVLAHEFGHIFTARRYGIATPDVTLLPIGGVARLERMPEKPSEELLIAIAGPLVNVGIAAALVLIGGADFGAGELTAMDSRPAALADRLAAVNIFLALFNMIPAFPMDGGRVLRALLAIRMGHVRATEIAAIIGQAFAFGLGFFGLFYNPLLIFIAIFVYLAAASEAQLVAVRAMARGMPLSAGMITQFAALAPDNTIDQAVDTLLHTSQHEFPVVDAAGKPVGLLDRMNLIRALKQLGPEAHVSEAMTPLPTVSHRRSLEDAFRLIAEESAAAVGCVDANGTLIGLITSETIGEMIMVNSARPKMPGSGPDSGRSSGPWSRPAGA